MNNNGDNGNHDGHSSNQMDVSDDYIKVDPPEDSAKDEQPQRKMSEEETQASGSTKKKRSFKKFQESHSDGAQTQSDSGQHDQAGKQIFKKIKSKAARKSNTTLMLRPGYWVEIHHIDVGQGESTLILVCRHSDIEKSVLVDGGKQRAADTITNYLLERLGPDRKLDMVVATHFDNDHIGGLGVIAEQDLLVDSSTILYQPHFLNPTSLDRDTQTYYKQTESCNKRTLRPDNEILNSDKGGPTLTCIAANSVAPKLNADETDYSFEAQGSGTDPNDVSIALLLEFDQFSYFLGGDLGRGLEDNTAAYAASRVSSDHVCAFKCSHHGSDEGTSSELLASFKPTAAFISCGRSNTFSGKHHPGQRVLFDLELCQTIQKYYLTNCGYWRWGVHVPYEVAWPDGTDRKFWEDLELLDPEGDTLTYHDPDDDPSYNPSLQDIFTKLESDKKEDEEELRNFIKNVAEITKSEAPKFAWKDWKPNPDLEECEKRVLRFLERLKERVKTGELKARKSDFLAKLKFCGYQMSELGYNLNEYKAYLLDPVFYKAFVETLKHALNELPRQINRDAAKVANWEKKKAVVAGGPGGKGPETCGHLVLEVDSQGAAEHRFRVWYFSREYNDEKGNDDDPPIPMGIEHRCKAGFGYGIDGFRGLWMAKDTGVDDKGSHRKPPILKGGDCLFQAVLSMLDANLVVRAGIQRPNIIDNSLPLHERVQSLRNLVGGHIRNDKNLYHDIAIGEDNEEKETYLENTANFLEGLGNWNDDFGDLAPLGIAHALPLAYRIIDKTGQTVQALPDGVDHPTRPSITYNGFNHYWYQGEPDAGSGEDTE